MTSQGADTNVNLSERELKALYEARRFAWIKRKFLRTKRYRRQYLRTMQRIARERRRVIGFVPFETFCTLQRILTPAGQDVPR